MKERLKSNIEFKTLKLILKLNWNLGKRKNTWNDEIWSSLPNKMEWL